MPAEFLKCNSNSCAAALELLFKAVWTQEKIPEDWRKGEIVRLPKKGDLGKPTNWRGITLLPYISKIFLKILHHRISSALEDAGSFDEEQAGFRTGRSCADHIFTMRNIIEQCEEWQMPLYVNFIDFQKAFDSVHRESLWRVMTHYGIPGKLIRLTKLFFTGFTCKVQGCADEDFFEVTSGVRQGCVISPLLFILVTDFIMKRSGEGHTTGLRWNLTTKLNYLAYADDLALFSTTHHGMSKYTSELVATSQQFGLHINEQKTKVLTVQQQKMGDVSSVNFSVNNKDLEFVEQFQYLGAKVDAVGGATIDIQN